ncbi:hypothetical protein [Salinibaculum rarum]|uniref:hypothetical protein n=1 Tax=Salinibaculum rarum TaxID=3058903 RepID=UPI00265F7D88|nr:hypothetical protein [Salinibaculum sp. KK48]
MSRDKSDTDGSDSADEESGLSRRRLLASGAATWATVSAAGCNYITDPGPPEQGGGGGDDDGSGDSTPTGNATVTNETTTTTGGSDGTTTGGDCQSQQEFNAGEEIALNVGVYESDTGEFLGGDTIDAVTVEFPESDIGPLELSWSGPHEQYIPDGWGGKLETDPDMEPGTYQYEINIDGEDVFDDEERIADRITIH